MAKIFVKLKDAGASYIDSTQERPMLIHGAEPFEVEETEMIKQGIRRGALVVTEGTPTESTGKAKEVKETKPKADAKGKTKEEVQEPTGEKQEGVAEK
jgi:hypothetical protein